MKIDYKDLLKKYMEHVIECEGISFIEPPFDTHILSNDEFKTLEQIESEIIRNHE